MRSFTSALSTGQRAQHALLFPPCPVAGAVISCASDPRVVASFPMPSRMLAYLALCSATWQTLSPVAPAEHHQLGGCSALRPPGLANRRARVLAPLVLEPFELRTTTRATEPPTRGTLVCSAPGSPSRRRQYSGAPVAMPKAGRLCRTTRFLLLVPSLTSFPVSGNKPRSKQHLRCTQLPPVRHRKRTRVLRRNGRSLHLSLIHI